MPTILPISDIIALGRVTIYLSANYTDRGNLFGGTMMIPVPPVQIAMVTEALEWGNASGAETDASLRQVANYLYWMCGRFQLQAQRILDNGSGGGGSVVPTPSGGASLNPYDWEIGVGTFPMETGDTTVTLDGTNGTQDFRGCNIEFNRNNLPQFTTPPPDGFSTYYSWNKVTGVFAVLNGAAMPAEQFRITPIPQ